MAKISFIAKDNTRYSFADVPQFLNFVSAELGAWNWLRPFEGHAFIEPVFANIVRTLGDAQTRLSQAPPDLETAKIRFQNYLDFPLQIHASAPLHHWLLKLAEGNPFQAAYGLAWMLQQEGIIDRFGDPFGGQSDYTGGILMAMAFQENWKPGPRATIASDQATEAAKNAASALADAHIAQSEIEELEQRLQASEDARITERNQADAAFKEKTESLLLQMEKNFEEKSSTLDTEWKRFNAEFNSQLALKAPSNYWKKKHKAHTNWVWGLGISLALGASLGAWILHEIAWEVFGPLRFNQLPSWFQVITFSLATLVYVLLLRSTLRLLMSHIHLALDSAERQIMIVSYLALSRRGAIKDESLDKILTSIFRPTGDGIVKDEGIPLSALSEIFKK